MATPNDDSIPWDSWISWFDNYQEGLAWDAANLVGIRWDEVFTSGDPNFHGEFDEPTPDAAQQTQTIDLQHNHLVLNGNNHIYDIPNLDDILGLDDIMTMDHPQTEPALTTEPTSPSSSGDINQTPSSGDFNFNSSPDLREIPYLSPNSLMEQSPQAYSAVPYCPTIDAGPTQLATGQSNISPNMRDGVAPGSSTMAPTFNVQQSPSQTFMALRQHTVEDCPPGMKKYLPLGSLADGLPYPGGALANQCIQTIMAQAQQARKVPQLSHGLSIPGRPEKASQVQAPARRCRIQSVTRTTHLYMVSKDLCEEGQTHGSFN